jgi:FkbM family methyltransferase
MDALRNSHREPDTEEDVGRVLLDVGANIGETVAAAIDLSFCFDRIVCFEPVESSAVKILRFADPRIEVHVYGLWNETTCLPLYDPGRLEGSLFGDKCDLLPNADSIQVHLERASDWVRANLDDDDEVYLKLNCEGAECDIVADLLEAGLMGRFLDVMIDFDVRKIPSLAHREQELRKALEAAGIDNVHYCEDVMIGPSHVARIKAWLATVGARVRFPLTHGLGHGVAVLISILRGKEPRIIRASGGTRSGEIQRRVSGKRGRLLLAWCRNVAVHILRELLPVSAYRAVRQVYLRALQDQE